MLFTSIYKTKMEKYRKKGVLKEVCTWIKGIFISFRIEMVFPSLLIFPLFSVHLLAYIFPDKFRCLRHSKLAAFSLLPSFGLLFLKVSTSGLIRAPFLNIVHIESSKNRWGRCYVEALD